MNKTEQYLWCGSYVATLFKGGDTDNAKLIADISVTDLRSSPRWR